MVPEYVSYANDHSLIQRTGGFLFVVTIMGHLRLLENTKKTRFRPIHPLSLSLHGICGFLYNIFRLIEAKSQKENTFMWFSEGRLKYLH